MYRFREGLLCVVYADGGLGVFLLSWWRSFRFRVLKVCGYVRIRSGFGCAGTTETDSRLRVVVLVVTMGLVGNIGTKGGKGGVRVVGVSTVDERIYWFELGVYKVYSCFDFRFFCFVMWYSYRFRIGTGTFLGLLFCRLSRVSFFFLSFVGFWGRRGRRLR